MVLFINKENYQNLADLIQKEDLKNENVQFRWAKDSPLFRDAISSLKEALDSLISKGIDFSIYNIPLCLLLGYKRYIRFDEDLRFKKNAQCKLCNYNKDCPGVSLEYYNTYGLDEIEPVGGGKSLTDLERCMVKILETENNISTQRILELAKRFRICKGCSSGSHVLITGERLIKKKMVKRSFKRGIYFWSLVK